MARKRIPSMGSVSSGTLRTEDLMSAFLGELETYARRGNGQLLAEARRWLERDEEERDDDEGSGIVNDLQDALDAVSPPFCYFGTHEGDGADFGWWPAWWNIDELPEFAGTDAARDARHVGEFRVVSDHGNVEIYVRHANGRIVSVLGIV